MRNSTLRTWAQFVRVRVLIPLAVGARTSDAEGVGRVPAALQSARALDETHDAKESSLRERRLYSTPLLQFTQHADRMHGRKKEAAAAVSQLKLEERARKIKQYVGLRSAVLAERAAGDTGEAALGHGAKLLVANADV